MLTPHFCQASRRSSKRRVVEFLAAAQDKCHYPLLFRGEIQLVFEGFASVCSSIGLESVRWPHTRQGEGAIHLPAEAEGLSGPYA